MAERILPKSDWQFYCDRISKGLTGKRANIEVTGLRIGDQIQAESLPLFGITYDPKDDLVEIAMEGLDHLIDTEDHFGGSGPRWLDRHGDRRFRRPTANREIDRSPDAARTPKVAAAPVVTCLWLTV